MHTFFLFLFLFLCVWPTTSSLNGRARMKAKYDWDVDGVMSQGDAALGTSKEDAQIYISTRQDFTMSHVTIAGKFI